VSEPIVIVGASLAGATAATTLRRDGFEGEIVLVGAEPHLPYERPPLSKSYLRGESPFEDAVVRPATFYADHAIELRLGTRASGLDTDRRRVRLDGDEIAYDRLLLATGSRERTPRFSGAQLEGVHELRTVDDCDRLRADAGRARRAVVCGMSFIGSEVAASLRSLGLDVTGVVSRTYPLQSVLGDELGRALADLHRAHGVRLVAEDRVAALEGVGRVEAVVTENGARLPCELAVLAIGVQPSVELAANTPIRVDDGIVVDERCRTNVEDVYACGDVARFTHPTFGRAMRVEHWHHARAHGRAAARSMLGIGDPYTEIPWFWSEQFDHEIQYGGSHTDRDERLVERGQGTHGLTTRYRRDGVLDAVAALDRPGDVRAAIAEIAARARGG
jgi:3-phenylpropionate/trans-cinnamate dioxygenase ferredoxin reductase subunit